MHKFMAHEQYRATSKGMAGLAARMTRHADRKLLLADIRARSMAASAGEQIDAAQEEQCAEAAPALTVRLSMMILDGKATPPCTLHDGADCLADGVCWRRWCAEKPSVCTREGCCRRCEVGHCLPAACGPSGAHVSFRFSSFVFCFSCVFV